MFTLVEKKLTKIWREKEKEIGIRKKLYTPDY